MVGSQPYPEGTMAMPLSQLSSNTTMSVPLSQLSAKISMAAQPPQRRPPAQGVPQRSPVMRQSSSPALLASGTPSPAASSASLLSIMKTMPVLPISHEPPASTGSSTPTAGFMQAHMAMQGWQAPAPTASLQRPPNGVAWTSNGVPWTCAGVCACGIAFAEGSMFCRKCGTRREEAKPQQSVFVETIAPASVGSASVSLVQTPQSSSFGRVTRQASAPLFKSAPCSGVATPVVPSRGLPSAPISRQSSITSLCGAAPPAPLPSPGTFTPTSSLSLAQPPLGWHHRIEEAEEFEYEHLPTDPSKDAQPSLQLGPAATLSMGSTAAAERCPSIRSVGSERSARWSSSSTAAGTQGCARCAVCHALLNVFAGRARVQAMAAATSLPRPANSLVERLLALHLTESDHDRIASSLCRFHMLHKNRFELWTQMHLKVKRCAAGTAGIVPQALVTVAERASDLDQIEAKVKQAGPAYMDVLGQFVKQLQQDVRSNISATLSAKAQDFVDNCQNSCDEVDEEISRKMDERRSQMVDSLDRVAEAAKEEFWRNQQRLMRQKCSSAASECRSLHKKHGAGGYTEHLNELAALELANKCSQSRNVAVYVNSKVDRERALKERDFDVWMAKMDQLKELQHDQAEKDRARIFARVDKTLKKWDEEQIIELRQVLGRFQQHVTRTQGMLEKIRRGQSMCLRAAGELEPFAFHVLRSEVASTSSVGGSLELSQYSSGPGATAVGQAIDESLGCASSSPVACTVELSAFAEFLGGHFPNLRAGFASIDITRTGQIACFELQTWMKSHAFPGEAWLILKELDRHGRGSVRMDNLRVLSSPFLHAGLRSGRPAGTFGAAILARLCSYSFGFSQERGTSEAFLAAVRCSRLILAFVSRAAASADLSRDIAESHDTTETSITNMLSGSSMPASPSRPSRHSKSLTASFALDAQTAGGREKEQSCTDIGRWAKQLAEPTCTERFSHMKFGGASRKSLAASPSQARVSRMSSDPPRAGYTSSLSVESRSSREPMTRICTALALEGSDDWRRHLRQHDSRDAGSALASQRTSKRGAPPPKTSASEAHSEQAARGSGGSLRSRSASRRRSGSVSVERPQVIGRQRSVSPAVRSRSFGSRRTPSASLERSSSDAAAKKPTQLSESAEAQRANSPARGGNVCLAPSSCGESIAGEAAPDNYGSMKLMRHPSAGLLMHKDGSASLSPIRSRIVQGMQQAGPLSLIANPAAPAAWAPQLATMSGQHMVGNPPLHQPTSPLPFELVGSQQFMITPQPFMPMVHR